jgi:hypothetical protein
VARRDGGSDCGGDCGGLRRAVASAKVIRAVKCAGVEVEALQGIILARSTCVSNTVITERNLQWVETTPEVGRASFSVAILEPSASVDAV